METKPGQRLILKWELNSTIILEVLNDISHKIIFNNLHPEYFPIGHIANWSQSIKIYKYKKWELLSNQDIPQ